MADLSITIGGDSSDFDREIRDVERQLQTLERRREARVRIGADVGDLDRRISQTTSNLTQLRNNLNQTSQSAQNFNRQTANGSNTLTQFSRIAQDAPFGIMGIGNNLTATAEAFANLSRNAGGARGALQAVGQSLLGGGGVLLAISLVTTGLTLMAQKGLTVGDVFDKITGNFNENRKAMQDLSIETAKNAQAQISSVGAYVSVAKNINLAMSDRLLAVKKLQDEYPAYFGNLTKEQILNGNVASTVKEVTLALIAKAKAAGLTDRIVKLAEEEEKIRIKINNQIYEAAKASKLTNAQTAILAGNFKALAQNGGDFMNTVNKVGKEANIPWLVLNGTIVRVLQGFTGLGSELRNNKAQQDRLTDSLEKQTAAQIKLEEVKGKVKAPKKSGSTPQVTGVESNLDTSGLIDLSGKITQIAKNVQGAEGVISTSMGNIRVAFDSSTIDMLETLYKFNDEASRIINDSIANTFSSLGQVIGEGLSSGGNILQSLGKTLLSSFGSILVELGKLLIKTGVGILAAKVALKSMNPYLAIAGGVALVAAGSMFSAQSSKIGDSIGGSGSSGSMSSGASYSSPASSSSYSSSGGISGGTVVFEIAGTSLIGVLNNALDKNKRLGGNLPI